ncbi:MAG: hypothetical protein ACHP7J_02005 [Terriglobales bacterium]
MRNRISIVLGVLSCLTVACSPRDFLTRRLAADLISSSDVFNAPQMFWLKTGTVSNKEFNSPDSMVLQRRGWVIGVPLKTCPPNVEPPPCWDAVLSPAGVDTFRPLIHNAAPSGGSVSLKVARRELVEITGISKAGNFADVEFTWHWIALNEVGGALYDSGVHYRSTTAFRSYDNGWRVVTEPVRSNQSLDEALRNPQPIP